MKKIILFICIITIASSLKAQKFSWGPKIGISSPNIKLSDLSAIGNSTENLNLLDSSSPSIGFQVGAFTRISVIGIYIQPEILFSNSKSEITFNDLNDADEPINLIGDVKLNKLDVPVLFGKRFLKIIRINAGPVFTLLLSQNLEQGSNTAKEIETNYKDATVAGQLGIGLDLAIITIDLRYEMALQNISDGLIIGGNEFSADQRLNQILLSVGMKF